MYYYSVHTESERSLEWQMLCVICSHIHTDTPICECIYVSDKTKDKRK